MRKIRAIVKYTDALKLRLKNFYKQVFISLDKKRQVHFYTVYTLFNDNNKKSLIATKSV